MAAAAFVTADTVGGAFLRAVDSSRLPLLFGGEPSCYAPGLWESALLARDAASPLYEGVPLLDAHADALHMAGVVLYLALFLGMVAFLRLQGRRILPMLFLYLFGRKRADSLLREDLHQEYPNVWQTLLVGYSALAMGAAFLWDGGFGWATVGLVLAALMLYQVALSVLVLFLGWVFGAPRCASEACLSCGVAHAVTALVLSPFALALFFVREQAVPLLLYVAAAVFLLLLVLKWMHLIRILFESKVSVFYMILYLCTLEITPLLVAYKLLG